MKEEQEILNRIGSKKKTLERRKRLRRDASLKNRPGAVEAYNVSILRVEAEILELEWVLGRIV